MKVEFQNENKIFKERIAESLTGFLLPFLTVLLLITLINNVLSEAQPTRILVTFIGLLSVVAAYGPYLGRKYYLACQVLVFILTADLLLAVYLNGGINAPALIAFFTFP